MKREDWRARFQRHVSSNDDLLGSLEFGCDDGRKLGRNVRANGRFWWDTSWQRSFSFNFLGRLLLIQHETSISLVLFSSSIQYSSSQKKSRQGRQRGKYSLYFTTHCIFIMCRRNVIFKKSPNFYILEVCTNRIEEYVLCQRHERVWARSEDERV